MVTPPNPDDGSSFREWYEQRMENTIANLLRAGVSLSALVVITGAVLYLGAHPRAHVAYQTFLGQPEQLTNVHGIVRSALSGQARSIMQLGLLLLIATPVARVVFCVFAFAVERDYMYVVFTLIVLSVLLYSLFGSFLIA